MYNSAQTLEHFDLARVHDLSLRHARAADRVLAVAVLAHEAGLWRECNAVRAGSG